LKQVVLPDASLRMQQFGTVDFVTLTIVL